MKKQTLRDDFKNQRAKLSSQYISDLSIQIANQTLKLPVWDFQNFHVFCTMSKFNEIETEYLMTLLMGKDKNIIVSKSDFNTFQMLHYLLTDNTTFKQNKWGIPEPQNGFEVRPSQIEVVFVPLLISDKNGYRVGYGKGFYDRFLAQCSNKVVKVGINFFEPIDQILDVDDFDIKLDWLVTPTQIYCYT